MKKEELGKSRGATPLKDILFALGYPVRIEISAGQVSDHIFAPKLIKDLNLQIVMADGGYDSIKFRQQIKNKERLPVFRVSEIAELPFFYSLRLHSYLVKIIIQHALRTSHNRK